jgi:hypothetical protein
MQHSIWKKGLVLGTILIFLGASTTLGINTSSTNPPQPRVVQHHIQAIPEDVTSQQDLVGNIKVSPSNGNDYHPRMTTNAAGDIIIVYEQEKDSNTKTVPVVYSADGGNTWTQQFLFNSLVFSGSGILANPDIIYNPAQNLLWFDAVDPDAELYNEEIYFIPGDISTATEAIGYAVSASTDEYFEAACTHTNDYFMSFTSRNYGEDRLRVLGLGWFMYPDFSYPPGTGGYYSDEESLIRISPVTELEADYNTNRWFLVAQSEAIEGGAHIVIKSSTTNKALINSGEQQNGMDKYGDPEQAPGEFLGLGTDPDVSGSSSNVAVVFVREGDILCSVSSCVATYEPEFHWRTTVVETGDTNTPAVYMQGDNVYCAYVKGENLYLKISEDGGTTWGVAVQKNDVDGTVVAEKGAVDIGKTGITFTDMRNGNSDIYYVAYQAKPTPQIVIDSISGGFGVTAVIKNIGDAPSETFNWSMTAEGNILKGGLPLTGAASLPPGLSMGIKRFMVGFGAVAVTVTVDTATVSKDFTLLLIYFKEV